MSVEFVIARNPDPDSSLPFLIRLPLGDGVALKVKDTWPRTTKIYCHRADNWPDDLEIVERIRMEAEIRADLGLWQCFPCSRRLRTDAATGSATGLGIERRLHSGDAEVLASVTIHNTNAIAARPQTEAMS